MRKFTTRKKVAAAIGAGAIAVAGAGTAIAFFSSTGSGTGSASVGSATPWQVTVGSDPSNTLYPGSGSESLAYTIKNVGSGSQAYTTATAAVVADGSGNIKAGGTAVAGCKASWFHATAGASTPVAGTSIAAGSSATGTITVTMDNDAANSQDACQGATGPDVTLSVS